MFRIETQKNGDMMQMYNGNEEVNINLLAVETRIEIKKSLPVVNTVNRSAKASRMGRPAFRGESNFCATRIGDSKECRDAVRFIEAVEAHDFQTARGINQAWWSALVDRAKYLVMITRSYEKPQPQLIQDIAAYK